MFRHFGAMFALLIALGSFPAHAQQRATAQEAVALVKKAAAHIQKVGLDAALKDFNNNKGQFVDRDLYIVVLDMSGRNLAHGANARIVGKDLIDFKDADGKLFIKEELQLAKTNGSGWVDFKFVNPTNQKIEKKAQYLERVGEVVVMSGIYKE
ncbi:cache domain-containing protein [Noviherbaspirillum saxi]|uniref:Histidine kinase n=1 Tax=Noviherbaspirillum saxi TaxID=2320863 RepID=A0A3A3FML9_9BURK|nr:cache domain-containing protein [Noviherbaspirillum saxi]RJF92585.1 histidine kinase [Noviherbaspirillum saxi]